MASLSRSSVTNYVNKLNLSPKVLFYSALAVIPIALFPSAYRSYKEYMSLGPSGPPYNVIGWFFMTIAKPLAKDSRTISVYSRPDALAEGGEFASTSFIKGELPQRKGERPTMNRALAPQRQLSDWADEELKKSIGNHLSDLATQYPKSIILKLSKLEGGHFPALYLSSDISPPHNAIRKTKGEFVHIHQNHDGTSHVLLSATDATKVLENKLGERHGLSGVYLPWGYTLLYAPRNKEEAEVVMRIMDASLAFVTGGNPQ
ncbi:MAG: hypothetical protein M1834_001363 [Cirrosporium novae-zelandiae]|nr:MAG: hypothetical protein M1834_001363 [Cirrosporium novae-zelandiae]